MLFLSFFVYSKGDHKFKEAVAALDEKLQDMDSLLLTTRKQLQTAEADLQRTKRELQQELQATRKQLVQAAKEELHASMTDRQRTNRNLPVGSPGNPRKYVLMLLTDSLNGILAVW